MKATMKCPHCGVTVHLEESHQTVGVGEEGLWYSYFSKCPACKQSVIRLQNEPESIVFGGYTQFNLLVFPRGVSRPKAPPKVDKKLGALYDEAGLICEDSPRAAGALLRRALQQLIREKCGIEKKTLDAEIAELLGKNTLPSHISTIIDAVRVVGNFSAHPLKNTNTGEIIDVEIGEIDLCFEVLDALFDFYYVSPAKTAAKVEALNKKLQDAGKKPIK
jgi:hypothetical protein